MNNKRGFPPSDQTSQTRRKFIKKAAILGAGLPVLGAGLPVPGAVRPAIAADQFAASGEGPGTKSWKIHLFSKHLQFLGYDAMAEASAEAGLDGVDLTVRPGGHVLPENVERDLPQAAKAIHKAGLELTMMTTRITDPEDPVTERILKVASDLGIRYYRMGYYKYESSLGMEENIETFKDKMSRLVVLNEKYGIHGAYQNHAGRRFGAPLWDLWQAIHTLDPMWIGCQYDIRHAFVEGAQSWPMGLELLKHYIKCMAIKDFRWSESEEGWRIENVPVGEGMVDFNAYFKLVDELNISGPISLHIEYPLFKDKNMPETDKKSAAVRTIRRDVQSLKQLLDS